MLVNFNGTQCVNLSKQDLKRVGKCFNNSVQSSVSAPEQDCEKLNLSAIAEIKKLQLNSSNCYQILNRCQRMVGMYFNDEKTQCSSPSKSYIT